MKRVQIQDVMESLEREARSSDMIGLAVISMHQNGKVNIQYTDYMATHPAQATGYLLALCHELTDLIRNQRVTW